MLKRQGTLPGITYIYCYYFLCTHQMKELTQIIANVYLKFTKIYRHLIL